MRHVNKSQAAAAAAAAALLCTAAAAQGVDPLGTVKVARGEPIVIGTWLALTGPAAGLGVDSKRAIEMAVEAHGTVRGHPVRLVGVDGACHPQRAADATATLVAEPGLLAVVGPSCSHEALAGVPALWKAGIPTVSPSNTAVRLTAADRGPAFDGYLRTAHNDEVQGRVAAEFADRALKVSKVATVHDGSAYAEALVAAFSQTFRRLGGDIVLADTMAPGGDARALAARLAASRPDLVYYPLIGTEAAPLTRALRELPALANVVLMSADGTFTPDFVRATGDAAKGLYVSSPDVTPGRLGPAYAAFVAAYQEKYGDKPSSPFHAQAHDAARLVLAAIERVAKADADGGLQIGRKALRDALFATRGFAGVGGTLTCDARGDCADPKIAVYQVQSSDASAWNPGRNPRKVYP